MASTGAEGQEQLAIAIRRQIGDRSTTRFAGTLPAYAVVSVIPPHLRDLLDRLETSEPPQNKRARS